ncbi:MAG TPA: hypothetical protein VE569_13830 [Acidimicrobiia bacterium]|nr:hypothetical protein [Acidimicrobiia bacterium]
MELLVGTVSGATTLAGETLVEDERINHVISHDDSWWAVDVSGRIFQNGDVVARMPTDVTAHCVRPTDQTTWLGADKARLFALEENALTEDEFFANAPDRDKWYTPWGAPADVRSMAVDADHTLYVNVHVGGVLRYDNTGVVPTIDIHSDVHQVAAHPNLSGAIFAPCAFGLAASHNGHDFDIRSDGLHASYCRAVVVLEDQVIVSASTGPRSNRARLYRGELWSGTFEPLTKGLPEWFEANLNTHCLVAREGTIYAGQGDTVWGSDDDGATWDVAGSGLPEITCLG